MSTTWVEREVPEHLEDKIHDMITFVLKAHGYGDGCEPIDLEQRREYLRQMVPKLDLMFHSEYDAYLKQHETVDYRHETVGYGFSVAEERREYLNVAEYNRLVIENDELKKRLFDAVRMIKNPNISNFGLRLKCIEDCLQEENYIEVKSAKALIKKNAILECIDIAWNAPEPDGMDVAHRIADAMGYLIVEGDEGITLEKRDERRC